ncbi:MAG: B12-binding domain-containing radical SAM protein [Candidatus Riflebacteria bacterium]|nr:B12-binding domain-containing radical SAM protein [Candidatus Riflebacteria bacterium]
MHVALVDPTFRHQGRLLKLRRVGYFPLTLPRLAACFPAGTKITLVYEKCQEIDTQAPYDLVLFTTMGSNLVRAEELSAVFRQRGIPTVVGGYSVAPFLDRCRRNFDAVALGDGEEIIPRLLADLAGGRLASVYQGVTADLTRLPPPRFDLVPPGVMGDIAPVETSRGCPNACDFCAVTAFYGGRQHRADVPTVLRDVRAVRETLGRRLVYFTDPNFAADMEHAKAVLRGLQALDAGVGWLASVDIRALQDEEFLRLARASGCFSLQVGFETLHPEQLRAVNKGFAARADYGEAIGRARAHGVPVVALMMLGFDTDTPATFGQVLRFLETSRLPLAVLHPVIPIPGTPLYDRLAREGRLTGLDPAETDGLHLHFVPRHFAPDAFLEGFWRLNRRLFGLRSVVRRFLHPDTFRNPLAYALLLFTNLFLAGPLVRRRLPLGMYE